MRAVDPLDLDTLERAWDDAETEWEDACAADALADAPAGKKGAPDGAPSGAIATPASDSFRVDAKWVEVVVRADGATVVAIAGKSTDKIASEVSARCAII